MARKPGKKQSPIGPPGSGLWAGRIGYGALVGFVVLLFFLPSFSNGFVNYDDERYILGNALTRSLSWDHWVRMFTTTFDGHYHPLTLLSHALDHALGRNAPAWVHGHSVMLHALSSALLFGLLSRWGGTTAALVGTAVFAFHPVVVESVSWASERKNVLSMVWILLTLHAYDRSLERDPRWGVLAIGAFVLALLAKTQAMVVWPALWAVDRMRGITPWRGTAARVKLLMLVPAIAAIIMTVKAQQEWSGSSVPYEGWERIIVASGAFARYIGLLVFPWGQLSAFHPYPVDIGQEVGPAAILLALAAVLGAILALVAVFRWPSQMAGALFFLVTLTPLLKFIDIPFGRYVMAERYLYYPLIGMAMLAAQGWPRLAHLPRAPRGQVLALAFLGGLALHTMTRQRVWQNSETLWTDVIDRYPDLGHAYVMRSIARSGAGGYDGALADLDRAVILQPTSSTPHRNKAKVLELKGDIPKAIAAMDQAITLGSEPDASLHAYRGVLHFRAGSPDRGLNDLDRALALADDAPIRTERGLAFLIAGRLSEAEAELKQALRHGAVDGHAEFLLAAVELGKGDRQKGCQWLAGAKKKGWPEADRFLREHCGRSFSSN